jgi:hypothetical protein
MVVTVLKLCGRFTVAKRKGLLKRFFFPIDSDKPFDTWNEIWLAWIGLMLTMLVVMILVGMLGSSCARIAIG